MLYNTTLYYTSQTNLYKVRWLSFSSYLSLSLSHRRKKVRGKSLSPFKLGRQHKHAGAATATAAAQAAAEAAFKMLQLSTQWQ